jgi:hypothetical protein
VLIPEEMSEPQNNNVPVIDITSVSL